MITFVIYTISGVKKFRALFCQVPVHGKETTITNTWETTGQYLQVLKL